MPTTSQSVGLIKKELQRRCKKVRKQHIRFYSGNSFKDVKTVIYMPRSEPGNSGIRITLHLQTKYTTQQGKTGAKL